MQPACGETPDPTTTFLRARYRDESDPLLGEFSARECDSEKNPPNASRPYPAPAAQFAPTIEDAVKPLLRAPRSDLNRRAGTDARFEAAALYIRHGRG